MMIPKTKAHIPPEIEQEMTIEPPVKRFFGVLVIGKVISNQSDPLFTSDFIRSIRDSLPQLDCQETSFGEE